MKRLFALLVAVLALPALAAPDGSEGLNATLWMQKAPEYAFGTEQAYRAATARLKSLKKRGDALVPADRSAAKPASRRPAIILDLDETVFDNTPFQAAMVAKDHFYDNRNWADWVARSGEVGLVPGARAFLVEAERQGFAIYYVSNRECDAATAPTAYPHPACRARDQTRAVLKRHDLPFADDPKALLLRNDQQGWGSKSARRQFLSARHRVAMLVGDDMGDFLPSADEQALHDSVTGLVSAAAADPASTYHRHARHFGDDWFIIANPAYGSWERALGDRKACAAGLKGAECHAAALAAKRAALVLPGARDLSLATWNMEWLTTPESHDAMMAACTAGQPPSHIHALPCTEPGRAPVPRHTDADIAALARYAARLGADVVALQEVDGPAVASRVFSGYNLDCFVARAHPQKTGFAIRQGIPYRCNPDLTGLDDDGKSRAGADVTLWPGTAAEIRLLGIHLKSGCFAAPLDDATKIVCPRLRTQVPVLEAWVDARTREGTAFAIMGDFNRRLEIDAAIAAGPDETAPLGLFQALNDNDPAGARLIRATEGAPYIGCSADDHYDSYIDNVVINERLAARATNRRFLRQTYDAADSGLTLSDHCPVGLTLEGAKP